jgi:hypothetical protein
MWAEGGIASLYRGTVATLARVNNSASTRVLIPLGYPGLCRLFRLVRSDRPRTPPRRRIPLHRRGIIRGRDGGCRDVEYRDPAGRG